MASRVVYKFPVGYCDGFGPVYISDGAEFVHVDYQSPGIYVWAICDPAAPLVTRRLGYFATGAPIPTDGVYVGTAKQGDGTFIWHVFEQETDRG